MLENCTIQHVISKHTLQMLCALALCAAISQRPCLGKIPKWMENLELSIAAGPTAPQSLNEDNYQSLKATLSELYIAKGSLDHAIWYWLSSGDNQVVLSMINANVVNPSVVNHKHCNGVSRPSSEAVAESEDGVIEYSHTDSSDVLMYSPDSSLSDTVLLETLSVTSDTLSGFSEKVNINPTCTRDSSPTATPRSSSGDGVGFTGLSHSFCHDSVDHAAENLTMAEYQKALQERFLKFIKTPHGLQRFLKIAESILAENSWQFLRETLLKEHSTGGDVLRNIFGHREFFAAVMEKLLTSSEALPIVRENSWKLGFTLGYRLPLSKCCAIIPKIGIDTVNTREVKIPILPISFREHYLQFPLAVELRGSYRLIHVGVTLGSQVNVSVSRSCQGINASEAMSALSRWSGNVFLCCNLQLGGVSLGVKAQSNPYSNYVKSAQKPEEQLLALLRRVSAPCIECYVGLDFTKFLWRK